MVTYLKSLCKWKAKQEPQETAGRQTLVRAAKDKWKATSWRNIANRNRRNWWMPKVSLIIWEFSRIFLTFFFSFFFFSTVILCSSFLYSDSFSSFFISFLAIQTSSFLQSYLFASFFLSFFLLLFSTFQVIFVLVFLSFFFQVILRFFFSLTHSFFICCRSPFFLHLIILLRFTFYPHLYCHVHDVSDVVRSGLLQVIGISTESFISSARNMVQWIKALVRSIDLTQRVVRSIPVYVSGEQKLEELN